MHPPTTWLLLVKSLVLVASVSPLDNLPFTVFSSRFLLCFFRQLPPLVVASVWAMSPVGPRVQPCVARHGLRRPRWSSGPDACGPIPDIRPDVIAGNSSQLWSSSGHSVVSWWTESLVWNQQTSRGATSGSHRSGRGQWPLGAVTVVHQSVQPLIYIRDVITQSVTSLVWVCSRRQCVWY